MAVVSACWVTRAVAFTRRIRALADVASVAGSAVFAAAVAGQWELRESLRPEQPDRTLQVGNTRSRRPDSNREPLDYKSARSCSTWFVLMRKRRVRW